MRILYEKEGDSVYAVSYNQEWNGYLVEDLFWAEVDPALGGFMCRWQDSYSNPVHFSSLTEAKVHIERNYFKHTPLVTGKQTFIK